MIDDFGPSNINPFFFFFQEWSDARESFWIRWSKNHLAHDCFGIVNLSSWIRSFEDQVKNTHFGSYLCTYCNE